MVYSMTGYCRKDFEFDGKILRFELKSLNSKHLDIKLRLPSFYKDQEMALRDMLHCKLKRGVVECNIYLESSGENMETKIDENAVASYYKQLKNIAATQGIPEDPNMLGLITRLPDVIVQTHPEISEKEQKFLLQSAAECMDILNGYRADEGKSLETDLRNSCAQISSLLDAVAAFEKQRTETVRQRLHKALEEMRNDGIFDQGRYEQEVLYYMEKMDVNEEKVRLKNHCSYFLEVLDSEGASGKKLGFIAQEMGREINTLGSKANHVGMQKLVVQMKEALEKIKEQVLNVL